jgi:hypothetical protein
MPCILGLEYAIASGLCLKFATVSLLLEIFFELKASAQSLYVHCSLFIALQPGTSGISYFNRK